MSKTTKAKGIIQVLRVILTDLGKLSDEELQALMDNAAKFKYFSTNDAKSKFSEEKAQEVLDSLMAFENEKDKKAYLNKFKVGDLQVIAKQAKKHPRTRLKADIIDSLINSPIRRINI